MLEYGTFVVQTEYNKFGETSLKLGGLGTYVVMHMYFKHVFDRPFEFKYVQYCRSCSPRSEVRVFFSRLTRIVMNT